MRTMTTRVCEFCRCIFPIRLSDVKRGRGRFCSKSHAASGKFNSSYKHGHTKRQERTKEYTTWAHVKERTTHPNKYYSDRGIKMCERWLNSFDNFLEDMGYAPTPAHSIERIDNDGNYEPGNCCWATREEQTRNRRSSKLIAYEGKLLTQEEWGKLTGIGGTTICKRLRRGWSIEKALTTPLKVTPPKAA